MGSCRCPSGDRCWLTHSRVLRRRRAVLMEAVSARYAQRMRSPLNVVPGGVVYLGVCGWFGGADDTRAVVAERDGWG